MLSAVPAMATGIAASGRLRDSIRWVLVMRVKNVRPPIVTGRVSSKTGAASCRAPRALVSGALGNRLSKITVVTPATRSSS